MYGIVMRMWVKPGQEQEVINLFKEWELKRKAKLKGATGSFLFVPDSQSGELVGAALFQDKASYLAATRDLEQYRWYRRLRDLLVAEPIWDEGEYVADKVA